MSDETVWFVSVEAPGRRAEWDWATVGALDPRALLPVRQPSSGDFSRHIPVSAYSVKTRSHHELESALEHELLRVLEQRDDVTWLVAQPVQLHVPGRRGATHVPDLLSQHRDGSVTIWDARPRERVDELFEVKAQFTRVACEAVGWHYEVFHGMSSRILRLNYRWLHEDRRLRPWHEPKKRELQSLLADGAVTVGVVMGRDDAALTSAMWHYAWTGDISCDLESELRATTELTWVGVDE
jgi:hypothetical protein